MYVYSLCREKGETMPSLSGNRVKLVFLAMALAVSFAAVLSNGVMAYAEMRCQGVSGDYERLDSVNWVLHGDISGERESTVTGKYNLGPVIKLYTLTSIVYTKDGKLSATEIVMKSTTTGRSIDLATITGGTGKWEDAKGRVIVPNDGGDTGRYFGYVCYGGND